MLICGDGKLKKSILAQSLHNASPVCAGPFLEIDTKAKLDALIHGGVESISNIKEDQAALGGIATPGTVFVDNVNRLSNSQQERLLNAIRINRDSLEISESSLLSGFRLVVGAPNEFGDILLEGQVREDMLFRLGANYISIAGLEMTSDHLENLSSWYCYGIAHKLGVVEPVIPRDSMKLLMSCDWPPNGGGLLDILTEAVSVSSSHGLISREILFSILKAYFSSDSLSRDATVLAMEVAKGDLSIAAERLGILRETLLDRLRIYGVTIDS